MAARCASGWRTVARRHPAEGKRFVFAPNTTYSGPARFDLDLKTITYVIEPKWLYSNVLPPHH